MASPLARAVGMVEAHEALLQRVGRAWPHPCAIPAEDLNTFFNLLGTLSLGGR